MTDICKENFFFFEKDCSNLKLKPDSLEHAYLAILNDDLDTALLIFKHLDSSRASWGEILTEILRDGHMQKMPTFFQIRNFFEIDVDFLIKNEKIDYVEQLLGALELFSTINQESYKFAARVMYENRLYSASFRYMEESKKIYYNDPELHFMYAKYYYESRKYKDAYFYINECLRLLPSYYPALILKEKIEEFYI